MSHYKANLRDIEFNLFEVLGIGAQLDAGNYGDLDTETARGILTEVLRLAEGPVADSFVDADRNPIRFDAANHEVVVPELLSKTVAAVNEAGWSALGMPEAMGGVNSPSPLSWATQEMLVAANNSAAFFNMGPLMHHVLFVEGTEEQQRWAQHAWENRWGGTMVLTEPDAGSDVGMGRTKAVQQPDGTWHIEGVKRFISGGDVGATADNIFHLTLARPEGAGPGTKGLSLFVVPKYLFDRETMELGERNGVLVTNLEHKMGIKSSPTCELTYGGEKPAIGYLVGEVHNGIAQMFKVIEHARMMVGVLSAGTLSTGYLNALEYAKTRVQGADLTQNADKTAPRVTITHHPDIRRSLALQKAYSEGLRALYLTCAAYQSPDIAEANFGADPELAARVNDLLLPIVKGVGSERAYEVLTETLQTFGGSGYLQDYPIEQYIRDVKIDSLYEGTTAIQAQDFFFRKIVRDKGVALGHLAGLIQKFVDADEGQLKTERALLATALADVQAMAAALTGYLVASQQTPAEIYKVGLGSVRFLHAAGDLVIGWRLLEQATIALAALEGQPSEKDRLFYTGKVAVASWFAKNQLPLLTSVRSVLENLDLDIMNLDEAAF
ncbi:acyl-CoA dehydrogenase [Nocardia sp. CDC159]|uniref:Broad-specificity linear acyl-CoA dehydrogenase FadE5 n=1 Tax=Nocardia pulmonis TaxID=2951408 RepID=A0A9X2EDF0_9NOCA|nr:MULTISPECIES: acyl-CoA dehydrogenase [Nocardia]MCM6777390.1 acyl-CoA dehydrogenase [Nocardia pulmonis]MCM6790275.1 acyl-CoA dehydrogenase [Nocardia sp. CDC159]